MYGIEKRILMRRYLAKGKSKHETAKLLGISRRTVYNWIAAGELERHSDDMTVRYGPRPPRPSMLDPYKATIAARLADRPQLSAAKLFREVKEAGYRGGYGQVKRYVRMVRTQNLGGVRPVPGADV